MAGEEEIKKPWPSGYLEAKSVEDFDFFMTGKDNGPITKVPTSRLAEVIGVVGESMMAIQGGSTVATAVELPDGPVGKNRFFDASWGYWKYKNVVLKNPQGTDGIPEGNDGTLYWNGTATPPIWSISKMQALPKGDAGKSILDWEAKVYAVGDQVFYESKIYESNADILSNDIPGVSSKWVEKISGEKAINELTSTAVDKPLSANMGRKLNEDIESKADISRVNFFDKNDPDIALEANINPASGAIFAAAGVSVTGWIRVDELTTYSMTNRNHLAWYDEKKVFISGVNFTTNPSKILTSPLGAKYCRLGVYNAVFVNLMFVKGAVIPPYVGYDITKLSTDILVEDSSLSSNIATKGNITQPFLSFADNIMGSNLFNKNDPDVTVGRYISPTSGVLAVNANYTATGFIPVTGGATYFIRQKTYIAWYDENKVYISGSTNTDTSLLQIAPVNAKYLRASITAPFNVNNFYVNKDSDKGYSEYEQYYLLKNVKAELNTSSEDELLVFLPAHLYCAVGRTLEIYNSQAIWTGNLDNFHVLWSGVGKAMKRKFTVTGSTENIGDYQLTLRVYDNNMKQVATAVTTVHIVPSEIITAFTLNPIGDSLTNDKPWLSELISLSGGKISYQGTRGAVQSGVARTHEGRSGATASFYLGNNSYTFDIAGQVGNDGRAQNLNPYWNPNTSDIDWNYYKTNYDKSPDKIMIWVGTNGITLDATNNVSAIKTLIDKLRLTGASTVPIYVCFTLFRGDQNGIGNQVNSDGFTNSTSWKLQEDRKVFNLQVGLYEALKDYPILHFIPISLFHDSKFNYTPVNASTPVNPRAWQTEALPKEAVHPQPAGFYQIADGIFSVFAGTQ